MGHHTVGPLFAGSSLFTSYPSPRRIQPSVSSCLCIPLLSRREVLTSLAQLAEAILTEPDSTLASLPGSIQLTDTRTPTDDNDTRERDVEREIFLPGDLSDDGSEYEEEEDGRQTERKTRFSDVAETNGNGVMGNLDARVSRIEVSPTVDQGGDAGWEDDDIDGVDEQADGRSRPGGLSAKAGSILVCTLSRSIVHE